MANDPNRDLLPVKEDCGKTGKGIYDKFDYQILGKLSRCELEDRFLRLLDEQTHIKKLANSQEEKIKRLGTKLLRLLNEKKIGKKILGQTKTAEELELRISELEHENYALKDKNIVLKQQLSNHTRHPPNHRSPLRSNYTSPLMTTRHSTQPPQSDTGYNTSNKRVLNEMQLQEAEGHITELNEEIKCLHDKIDYLQRNLEKNCLDNRKVKVTENIELIRLQRALKQQAIQIACLQAQIKNSEFCQKGLKEELLKAHRENDDALQVISLKQNEILNLCSKLEENKLSRLEEDELKGRIDDLVRERDTLRERSDYLIKTIGARDLDAQKICELQKALEEEKLKKEKLEEAVEVLNKDNKKCSEQKFRAAPCQSDEMKTVDRGLQAFCYETKNVTTTVISSEGESESLCNRCHFSIAICKCGSQETIIKDDVETETEQTVSSSEKEAAPKRYRSGECEVEKVKMKRELQCLREMLKSQTERCEAQQAEIARLMCELKINEEKCNETLRKLDFHLRIFQCLELQERQKNQKFAQECRVPSEPVEPQPPPVRPAPPESPPPQTVPSPPPPQVHRSPRTPRSPRSPPSSPAPLSPATPPELRESSEPVVCIRPGGLICSPSPTPTRELLKIQSSRISTLTHATDIVFEPKVSPIGDVQEVESPPPPPPPPPQPPQPRREVIELKRIISSGFLSVSTQTQNMCPPKKDATTQVEQPAVKDVGISVKLDSSLGLNSPSKENKDGIYLKPLPPSKELNTIKQSSFGDDNLGPKSSPIKKPPTVENLNDSYKNDNYRHDSFKNNNYKSDNEREPSSNFPKRQSESEKKRFVEQKFLDSSDDDLKVEENFKRDSFLSKVRNLEYDQQRAKDQKNPDEESDSDYEKAPALQTKKSKTSKYNFTYSETSLRDNIEEADQILVSVLWLKVEPGSTLWMNTDIDMLFVDFTFLDLRGAETETPQSLAKPNKVDDLCQFNFVKKVEMTVNRKKMLSNLLKHETEECITFKVVSDSERYDVTNDECEDVGMAIITVKDFIRNCNKGPFHVSVKSVKDPDEVIGVLGVNFDCTPNLLAKK